MSDMPPEVRAWLRQEGIKTGRLGGRKGGPLRKKALTKKRRREIAREAARTRWAKIPDW